METTRCARSEARAWARSGHLHWFFQDATSSVWSKAGSKGSKGSKGESKEGAKEAVGDPHMGSAACESALECVPKRRQGFHTAGGPQVDTPHVALLGVVNAKLRLHALKTGWEVRAPV